MSLKLVSSSHHGGSVKMGRRRPISRAPRLSLRNYLRATLPPAPPSCDYSPRAASVLANIYGNDKLGDCVIAGGYHVVGIETGNAGDLFTATSAAIGQNPSSEVGRHRAGVERRTLDA
jgi:hypothetical protein